MVDEVSTVALENYVWSATAATGSVNVFLYNAI